MKKVSALFAPVLALTLLISGSAAASDQVYREMFPISVTNYNDCTQEDVQYTGIFHIVVRETENHFLVHFNPLNVTGVGVSSGTTYQFVGGPLNVTVNNGRDTFTYSEVNNLVLVSQGSEMNLLARFVAHFTMNANGDVTSDFGEFSLVCRG